MDVPSKEIVEKLPLAEAVLLLMRWCFQPDRLESIWDRFRGRCYEKLISFALMVKLIGDALLNRDSGRKVFSESIENDELQATIQAAFKKLSRIPLRVSESIFEESTASVNEVFPDWARWQGPASLRKFRPIILDGKVLKHIAKRLGPLRGSAGGVLGGRALVALDWTSEMAIAMVTHPDGDANDVAFVDDLVPKVRNRVKGTRLWMGDRAFCCLKQIRTFTSGGDHFVIRYRKTLTFTPDMSVPAQKGEDELGRPFVSRCGWLGKSAAQRIYVRYIQVERKDQEPLVLVTDLIDCEAYPTIDLLWLYRERWGIERVFQKVTEVFGLLKLIGGTPQACVFQFAFCLLLYNIILVMRGIFAQQQDLQPDNISLEKMFEDVTKQVSAWELMNTTEQTLNYFSKDYTATTLANRLNEILNESWTDRWIKPPNSKTRNTVRRTGVWTHHSVFRILQQAKLDKLNPMQNST